VQPSNCLSQFAPLASIFAWFWLNHGTCYAKTYCQCSCKSLQFVTEWEESFERIIALSTGFLCDFLSIVDNSCCRSAALNELKGWVKWCCNVCTVQVWRWIKDWYQYDRVCIKVCIQVSVYSELRYLDASDSGMEGGDFHNNTMLVYLSLGRCGLHSLTLTYLPNLRRYTHSQRAPLHDWVMH
jgi:hypothetical protein